MQTIKTASVPYSASLAVVYLHEQRADGTGPLCNHTVGAFWIDRDPSPSRVLMAVDLYVSIHWARPGEPLTEDDLDAMRRTLVRGGLIEANLEPPTPSPTVSSARRSSRAQRLRASA